MNANQNQNAPEAIPAAYLYFTTRQFCERHKFCTTGGLRHEIFNEDTNGAKAAGVFVRHGRKVLIKESAYFAWLEARAKAA